MPDTVSEAPSTLEVVWISWTAMRVAKRVESETKVAAALTVSAGPSVSLDGYMAGPRQDQANPIGVGGSRLHVWIFATRSGREMMGQSGGSGGVDDEYFKQGLTDMGATIMGRNMFGPIRGPWEGTDWRGWWGEEPPFHSHVFVLTHFERADLEMGDTVFHFVTDGVESALRQARARAGDLEVGVSGGAQTLRQFLDARLIDQLHVAVVPVTLREGARLFDRVGEWPEGYECGRVVHGEGATHYELVRSGSSF